MPNIQSAEKALRQSKKRRAGNLFKKNEFKSAVKDFKKLIAAGKYDDAKLLLPKVYQKLDKAAKVNVIKWNKADRLKANTSRMLAAKK